MIPVLSAQRLLPKTTSTRKYRPAILLVLIAMVISLNGPAGYDRELDSRSEEPRLDALIMTVGEELDHGIDPRRAVFLFQPIDLNLADVETLCSLRGIGPKLAGRIVAWRDLHGGFKKVAELLEVKGIGKRKMTAIASEVIVVEHIIPVSGTPDV